MVTRRIQDGLGENGAPLVPTLALQRDVVLVLQLRLLWHSLTLPQVLPPARLDTVPLLLGKHRCMQLARLFSHLVESLCLPRLQR